MPFPTPLLHISRDRAAFVIKVRLSIGKCSIWDLLSGGVANVIGSLLNQASTSGHSGVGSVGGGIIGGAQHACKSSHQTLEHEALQRLGTRDQVVQFPCQHTIAVQDHSLTRTLISILMPRTWKPAMHQPVWACSNSGYMVWPCLKLFEDKRAVRSPFPSLCASSALAPALSAVEPRMSLVSPLTSAALSWVCPNSWVAFSFALSR